MSKEDRKSKWWKLDLESYHQYKKMRDKILTSRFPQIRARAVWWQEQMDKLQSRWPTHKME